MIRATINSHFIANRLHGHVSSRFFCLLLLALYQYSRSQPGKTVAAHMDRNVGHPILISRLSHHRSPNHSSTRRLQPLHATILLQETALMSVLTGSVVSGDLINSELLNTNWETYTFPNGTIEACYLNTTLGIPCQQGSVPVIGVDARMPGDIQAAVKFVAKHNLRLVVRNTG
jgi:hypothetical protein